MFSFFKFSLLMSHKFALTMFALAFFLTAGAQRNTKPNVNPATTTTVQPVDYNAWFNPLKWRSIGPFRGGRAVAVAGVPGQIGSYYMGTTGGGLWKTEDMGITWHNISDGFFKTGSVGAVAVSESDPHIVYVGMGEHAVRGVMTHHGDGLYKSTDSGKTWTRMGLEHTQHISRVSIHPKNPDIVFVAAQGPLYSPSPERGVFKTTDGGKTWEKVLYVDEKTGCAELAMDMNHPDVLYAAMWEHGRLPWKVISGGPGSGLYKSTDGGQSWEKIHNGLPAELGKMAVSVCRSNPDRVYALIESDSEKELGGLFVSPDAGKSWSRVSADHRLIQRAWYYTEVYADPQNEHTVYVLSAPALRSIDGGKTWEDVYGPHGDYHDLWINPQNPRNMAIADDGGVGISLNYGKTWSSQSNMPTAQLYRINVDNAFPYRIYAGQQDNTSVVIASQEFASGGITPESWTSSAGGESAFLAFDPDNPRFVMGGSYLGTIEVLDTEAKAGTNIMAAPIQYLARDASDMKYRFNWNAPIIWSKHEPGTFYHAAQLLLRTRDMGQNWEEVSPDLTRNDKSKQGKGGGPYTNEVVGAENYGTISYVMESPHEKGVIWVGSDDGLVHLTRDGGKSWQNVSPAGLAECLVNAIEVSPHDPATAYIATTRYKFNDHAPGLYKTTDYGKTWTSIHSGIPQGAFTRVVREDDVRKDLLFAGTETGLYISWNGGKLWHSFQLNLPITPITDLRIHQGDLIAATSGRSFWILDDLYLLRQYRSENPGFFLFQPQPAMPINGYSELDGATGGFTGAHPTRGVNPPTGAVLYYFLDKEGRSLSLEIRDAQGKLVRTLSAKPDTTFQSYDGGPGPEPTLSTQKGLNRFVWDLRHSPMPGIPTAYIEGSYRGRKVAPGKYQLLLRMDTSSVSTMLEVKPNPLYPSEDKNYEEWQAMMGKMEAELTRMHRTVNTLYALREQLEGVLRNLPANPSLDALKADGHALATQMKAWDEDMVQRKSKAYDDVENFPNKFTANYLFLINHAESGIPRVNQGSRDRLKELTAEWEKLEARARQILEKDIPEFNKRLWDAGFGVLWKN
jgi:photosystem II stability/assembly factor-like uncharacterized protein